MPIPIVRYGPQRRPEDRAIAEWLRGRPSGAALHLPLVVDQNQELNYQYATLFHHHPLINGFTGWASPLQELLRQPRAPLYDYERYPATVRMLRSLGVRYVFVHPGEYGVSPLRTAELTNTVDGFRLSGQVHTEARLLDVYAFDLEPFDSSRGSGDTLQPMPASEFRVEVSPGSDRTALLVDGDNDTRWMAMQDGTGAITVRFGEPRDVARLALQLSPRSMLDYPRDLQIDAQDREGRVRTLYRATPYPEFIAGFLRDRFYPSMQIDLPRNDTTVLWVRDLATYDTWWSVYELRLWRRQ